MSYKWDEWDENSPVVLPTPNNTIQSTSFQNSSYQRRNYNNGGPRGRFNSNRFDGGGPRRGGGGRGAGGGGRFNNRREGNSYSNMNRNGDAKMIKIPTRFVGRVIGRGGSKISDLQFESGAKIIVTKEEENNETAVKLIGSQEEVEKAEMLIKDLTVDRESSRTDPPVTLEFEIPDKETKPEFEPISFIDWAAANAESVSVLYLNILKLINLNFHGFSLGIL